MPSYIAEGVIQPFASRAVRILFYRLTETLQPDQGDVIRLLRENPGIRLLVVFHPLGYVCEFSAARREAGERGVFVLEDCAHSLFTDYSDGGVTGSRSDFSLFSLNKFLPVPDGAILVSMRPEVNVAVSLGDDRLPRGAIDAYLLHLELNAELLSTHDAHVARGLLADSGAAYDRYYEVISDRLVPLAVSNESVAIRARCDAGEFRTKRRRNLETLCDNFPSGPIRLLYREAIAGAAPFAVPAVVDAQLRDMAIEIAFLKGVFLATLCARWDFVPREGNFEAERSYLRRHFLIPINEFLDDSAMLTLLATMAQIQKAIAQ